MTFNRTTLLLSTTLFLTAASFHGQTSDTLPDSPGAARFSSSVIAPDPEMSFGDFEPGFGGFAPKPLDPVASKYRRTIMPGQQAQPLSGPDKIVLALRDRVNPRSFVSTLFSAGWNHLNDGRPHYGTDKAGFGERLGAAALKQSSQSILGFGVYSALLHEDPRYYLMGHGHSIKDRLIYAATRVVITRKDSGEPTVFWANIAGIASSNALTNAYYPTRDTGLQPTLRSFGTGFATAALSNEMREFLGDAINMIRHKK